MIGSDTAELVKYWQVQERMGHTLESGPRRGYVMLRQDALAA